MSDVVNLLGALDGIGGLLLTLQCARFVYSAGKYPRTLFACRDEVFKPLEYLYKDQYYIEKLPEITDPAQLDDFIKEHRLDESGELYCIWPDELFRNSYAFDYKKYNVTPQTIKTTRTLIHKWKPEKIIYVGLNTTTEGYNYHNSSKLVNKLAEELPEYTIYFPIIEKWAGKEVKDHSFEENVFHKNENVFIDRNPDFVESLKWLEKSCYCICTDNGISHLSFHLGQQRLLLDPRFGFNRPNMAFYARWRETEEDSIDLKISVDEIVVLVKLNLSEPATTLLPKRVVLNNLNADWARELIYKY